MKKNSLTFISILIGIVFTSVSLKAQTSVLYQNFETSKTAIPAGWTQQVTAGSSKGWVFGNTFTAGFSSNIPAHTYYALVDDYDNNTGGTASNDTLYSSVFSCVGHTHVFVSFDLMYCILNQYENANLIVSNDGGKTWNTIAPNAYGGLPWSYGTIVWQDSLEYDISAYAANQANVKIGFAYFNGCPNPYGNQGSSAGIAVDNIDVYEPLKYDVSVQSQNLAYLMQVGTPYTFTGTMENFGGDSIVSLQMCYNVNGGAIQRDNITGISAFTSLTTYNYTHNLPFTPSAAGTYKVKIWADSLNGKYVDQLHKNDTLYANFVALAAGSIQPREALYEEVMGQSCYYCMLAAPNVDSVSIKNKTTCNPIHYHLNNPGPDKIYSADSAASAPGYAVGDTMAVFYNIPGTPDALLDGVVVDASGQTPGANYSTVQIAQEVSIGSPIKINITSCTYATNTNIYSLTADITSYQAFPAGLRAKVALVIDSITYFLDYSADDPKSGFQPPIGTTSAASGGDPDYLFPYLLKFPNSVEALMPNDGTGLNSFTAGAKQSINVSWKKNHPFSYERSKYPYDSSATAHMVVFVQSDTGISSLGILTQYVLQSASAPVTNIVGVQEIGNGVYFNMYPNPTNGNTNIVYNIAQEQNVSIEVFDMLGQRVYSEDLGKSTAGQHTSIINCGGLQSGIYLVRFTADNASTTQRLIIQK
jgi:hypothetical protein